MSLGRQFQSREGLIFEVKGGEHSNTVRVEQKKGLI